MDKTSSVPRRWDPIVKLTHWGIVTAVIANAIFTEEGSGWHIWVGYGLAALLGLRLLWGLIGPAEARFSAFPPSPGRAIEHLGDIGRGEVKHNPSHNPLGALMVYAIWAMLLVVSASGIAMSGPPPADPSAERGEREGGEGREGTRGEAGEEKEEEAEEAREKAPPQATAAAPAAPAAALPSAAPRREREEDEEAEEARAKAPLQANGAAPAAVLPGAAPRKEREEDERAERSRDGEAREADEKRAPLALASSGPLASDAAAAMGSDPAALSKSEELGEGEEDEGEEAMQEVHEIAVNLLYVLIALHLAGVIFETRRSGRQIVQAMIPGGSRQN